jgi:N-methylhydantoinase B
MKHLIPPSGCAGGLDGRTGDIVINPDSESAKRLPTRYADYPLRANDVFRLDTPGGGGYGDPTEREPERVLADVREGYVTRAAAERVYGVVLVQTERGLAIDAAATARKRNKGEP